MLFKLLGLPLTLPAAGIKFCFQQVLNSAERELYDDEPVKEQLLLLTLKLEEGEITEDEYVEQEAFLHMRLREIRAYREAQMKQQLAARAAQQGAQGAPAAQTANPRTARIELAADFGPDLDR
jgi:hypothetical protein